MVMIIQSNSIECRGYLITHIGLGSIRLLVTSILNGLSVNWDRVGHWYRGLRHSELNLSSLVPTILVVVECPCLLLWIPCEEVLLVLIGLCSGSAKEIEEIHVSYLTEESPCENLILLVLVFLFDILVWVLVAEEAVEIV